MATVTKNATISMGKSPHFPRYLRSKLRKSLVLQNLPQTHPGPGSWLWRHTWHRSRAFLEILILLFFGKLAWKMSVHESKASLRWKSHILILINANPLTPEEFGHVPRDHWQPIRFVGSLDMAMTDHKRGGCMPNRDEFTGYWLGLLVVVLELK